MPQGQVAGFPQGTHRPIIIWWGAPIKEKARWSDPAGFFFAFMG